MKLTKKEVRDHLSKYYLMQVATYGKHPWIASVYYSFDKDLNLYFISDPTTLHCQQIKENPKVSVAVVDSNQPPSVKEKIGLQMWGNATQVSNKNKVAHLLKLWKSTKNLTSNALPLEELRSALLEGRVYKIEPKVIKIFDSLKYKDLDEGQEPILKF